MAQETKIITQREEKIEPKRELAQKVTFEQIQELVQRNVTRNLSKTYTQYTKDTVKTYLQSPSNSLSNIIEISRFLERNSSLYKKLISYYAATPLFYYNLTPDNDLSKTINTNKMTKSYYEVAKALQGFNIPKEMYNAIYCCVRDGMWVGFQYGDESNTFFMPLDIKYCRIYGKNEAGEWIVYFDANYFTGNNSIFVEGINGDTSGVWDEVFVEGYNNRDAQRWFRLPPEKTFCLIAGSDDQFDVPLPLFAPIFISLMDLADLESIIASKSELENYKVLVSKIPLVDGTDDVDDFAISFDLATRFNRMLEEEIPSLVACVTSPMDLDVIDFNSNSKADDTDYLSQSIQNLFNNIGVSQLVVAGGSSSNSVGLKHALNNDIANMWVYVNRIESWINYYIKTNISEGYLFEIHKITWLNQEEYQSAKKDIATLGGSALDLLTSYGDTPYVALQKLHFEEALGIKSMMKPLSTSYTQSSAGAPRKDDGDLSQEGLNTRDADKNNETKANS